MDDATLEILARSAGLDRAFADFRDDLKAAAEQVEKQRRTLAKPLGPADEPWPPMRVEKNP
ncbi:MAG TPA: hypothetical protein VLX09_08095 [Stellaceae bacterium]|nr:hypothetical protein [Stellaceae bacterium]